MKRFRYVFLGLAVVFAMICVVFLVTGFGAKNDVDSTYLSLDINAQAAREVYGAIIGGTHFVGYMVLAAASGLTAVTFLLAGLIGVARYFDEHPGRSILEDIIPAKAEPQTDEEEDDGIPDSFEPLPEFPNLDELEDDE